jgi:hypothetical protein
MATKYNVPAYIYLGIRNQFHKEGGVRLKWNYKRKLYKYSNTLLPNKKFKKTFDPKFMKKGDILQCGDDKHDKLIYDGKKLLLPFYDIEDDGSIPGDFVVGDKEGEFDIGYWEDAIDSKINWLSYDKLREITFFINDNKVEGRVRIKNKEWKIIISTKEMNKSHFYSENHGHYDSFKGNVQDEKVYIDWILDPNRSIENIQYLIKPINTEDSKKLIELVEDANSYYEDGEGDDEKYEIRFKFMEKENFFVDEHLDLENQWFAYSRVKVSYLLKSEDHEFSNDTLTIKPNALPNFPLLFECHQKFYHSILVFNKEEYEILLNTFKNHINHIWIEEIIGYPITAELIVKDNYKLINEIEVYIKYIINNNYYERLPFYRDGEDILKLDF